jgi:hypothetical protein
MNGLRLSTSLATLLGSGASGEASVGPADKFTFDGGGFTLLQRALGARFTLSTFDPAASGK